MFIELFNSFHICALYHIVLSLLFDPIPSSSAFLVFCNYCFSYVNFAYVTFQEPIFDVRIIKMCNFLGISILAFVYLLSKYTH